MARALESASSVADDVESGEPPGRHTAAGSTDGQDRRNAAALVQGYLSEVVGLMGAEAEVAVTWDGDRLNANISGTDAADLVGKRGSTLDAFEYLLSRVLAHRANRDDEDAAGAAAVRGVTVDSDDYRKRREESLIELAQRLGEKALDEAKIVALNPMSARDRRIIHMTLRDIDGLTTHSEGEGDERRLLIVPEAG